MSYRTSDKMRRKKDAKRTAMMQAAVKVFSEKGYHAATVRDIVQAADVAIGTFYFYFPDKETLFTYLYEETADFLVQAVQQGVVGRKTITEQIAYGIQSYVKIALFEPAVVQLLLVGGVGAVPSLTAKREQFRESIIRVWQKPLNQALDLEQIPPQNTRRAAEAICGACDEVVLNLLQNPRGEEEATAAIRDLTLFVVRGVGLQSGAG